MTVTGIKGDHVDCFWTDWNGQINADSFPLEGIEVGRDELDVACWQMLLQELKSNERMCFTGQ